MSVCFKSMICFQIKTRPGNVLRLVFFCILTAISIAHIFRTVSWYHFSQWQRITFRQHKTKNQNSILLDDSLKLCFLSGYISGMFPGKTGWSLQFIVFFSEHAAGRYGWCGYYVWEKYMGCFWFITSVFCWMVSVYHFSFFNITAGGIHILFRGWWNRYDAYETGLRSCPSFQYMAAENIMGVFRECTLCVWVGCT